MGAISKYLQMFSGSEHYRNDIAGTALKGEVNPMKKRNILLLVIIFYFVICWKLSFYILLLGIDLPEDAIVIKRQVSYTDVYNPHILAEMVFVSDLSYGNIKETILGENRIIMIGENINLMDWHIFDQEMDWDDYYISVKEMDELADRIGYQYWYYVSFEMYVVVYIFLSMIFILMVLAATGIFLKRKKRIER